jgi:DinB superfamily
MSDRNLLLRILDEAYDATAWHGATLRGSLGGVTPNQAFWRPAEDRHNIWELMLHAAYWKFVARRRLMGDRGGTFARKGRDWFQTPSPTEEAWQADLALLDEHHQALRKALARAPAKRVEEHVRAIYGVAAHDVYHTGQIQLLKRLYGIG